MNGLSKKFETLFENHRAKNALLHMAVSKQTNLPTFNLATTSLRHLNKWFDRLDEINQGIYRGHGNYYSDPATIGLVNKTGHPPTLTPAGLRFLSHKKTLYNDPAKAEYQLIKTLYFSDYEHSPEVQDVLEAKQKHMLKVLEQFSPSQSCRLFLSQPDLLVIAELIASFPGAVPRLVNLPPHDLLDLAGLGENGFKKLCSGQGFLPGLARLCRRIGCDYTRGQERRLHYIINMALISIAKNIPHNKAVPLVIPSPFSNLLTEIDVYKLHSFYTSDIVIWFDGTSYQTSSSIAPQVTPRAVSAIRPLSIQLQTGTPSGTGIASSNDNKRKRRRAAKPTKTTIIIDQIASERSEDFIESNVLSTQYGPQLVRVGHRVGEILSLPDGLVPGADFYVINDVDQPIEFIEIKSISGNPPVDVSLTRAEYLRACRCAGEKIPYRIFLVNLPNGHIYELSDFASEISIANLSDVIQFTIRVG